jgi:DNA invertase Pin-like site-specific DNA recombinase
LHYFFFTSASGRRILNRESDAYVRWSTDDQSAGNSLDRQTANIKVYCESNGLELAETLIDDGYSAFKGDHIVKGALGRFLTAADKGKYKGWTLVVEQLDRLSRQGISEASDLLKRILKDEITVHITGTNRVIRSLDDVVTALLNVLDFYGAQEYSKRLKERVGKAWSSKKHDGANGIAITGQMPAWLEARTGEPIRVNEQKAEIVRQIFEMTAGGMGKRLIARRLNEQRIPTFGRGRPSKSEHWVHSYIHKLQMNRAVLGEYQPRKGGKPDGDVRIDFFPAIVTPELWQRAHTAINSRRTDMGAGAVTGKYAGRTGKISNLFTGLVWDVTNLDAKKPMHYSDKHNGMRPRLTTEKTTDGGQPNRIYYDDFENSFLSFFDMLDWTEVLDVAESDDLKRTEEEIASLGLDIARGELQVQKLTDLLLDTPSKALKERLLKTEAQIEVSKANCAAAKKRLADQKQKHHDLLDESVVFSKLAKARDVKTRARLRQEIRKKVSKIEIYFGSETSALGHRKFVAFVTFANNVKRQIVFGENEIHLIKSTELRQHLKDIGLVASDGRSVIPLDQLLKMFPDLAPEKK